MSKKKRYFLNPASSEYHFWFSLLNYSSQVVLKLFFLGERIGYKPCLFFCSIWMVINSEYRYIGKNIIFCYAFYRNIFRRLNCENIKNWLLIFN